MKQKPFVVGAIAFSLIATFTHAAVSELSGLGGTTTSEGWSNLTASAYSGYGSFPGTGAWPDSIPSQTGSSVLTKISNGTGGGPYLAGTGIYHGGMTMVSNTNGGTLGVGTTIPLADLQTVVFQIEIGEALGYDFFNDALPTLSYTVNGISSIISATYSSNFEKVPNGTFAAPDGPQDLFNNSYALQYDLSGVDGTISDFSIEFSGVQHSIVYSLYLQQSDQALSSSILPAAVPEPASAALLGLSSLFLFRRRRA